MIQQLSNLINLYNAACKIDILDMNYTTASEKFDLLGYFPKDAQPEPGLLRRALSLIKRLLIHTFKLQRERPAIPKTNLPLMLIHSDNQKRAFDTIKEHMHGCYYGGIHTDAVTGPSEAFAHYAALLFLPKIIKLYKKQNDRVRESFRYRFDEFWLTYGYYIATRIWLHELKPSVVLISNDHIMRTRVTNLAARQEGIPTIYIQHASAADRFPPLSFDFALLEGMDAANKYNQAGSSPTKSFLIGIPRADSFLDNRNRNNQVHNLGICTNSLDPIDKVASICLAIKGRFPDLNLSLRPHPSELWLFPGNQKICYETDARFSNPLVEAPMQYLGSVDAIIACDCNIILEASLINVFPIYYDFAQKKLDYYGFLKNGLVSYRSKDNELIAFVEQLVQKKPDIRQKAKYYCNTLLTPLEGKSTSLAVNLIKQIIEHGHVNLDDWRIVDGLHLETYEPKA